MESLARGAIRMQARKALFRLLSVICRNIRCPKFQMVMVKLEANNRPVVAAEDVHVITVYKELGSREGQINLILPVMKIFQLDNLLGLVLNVPKRGQTQLTLTSLLDLYSSVFAPVEEEEMAEVLGGL